MARQVASFSLDVDLLRRIADLAGADQSAFVGALLEQALQGGGPPLLKNCRVHHALSHMERPPYTTTVGPSTIHANPKTARDLEDPGHGVPITVHHGVTVPRAEMESVRSSEHYMDPACPGCRDVVRTYRG